MSTLIRSAVLLAACTPTPPSSPPTPLDTTVPAATGTVRGGSVAASGALLNGIAAEGRVGDWVLYNDRVRFIVQGLREGSSYVQAAGTVIDADFVRPEGELSRDMVEDWFVMPTFLRVTDVSSVELIDDGRTGTAILRVTGIDKPMPYIVGALEDDALVQPQGLDVVTEYRLRPDTPLLEVVTTITATRDVTNIQTGDALIGSPEVAQLWTQGEGTAVGDGPRESTGYVGTRNDGTIATLSTLGNTLQYSSAASLLTDRVQMAIGLDETVDLVAGESRTWTRTWGVGPDLATLTDARLGATGQLITGTVTDPDGPVSGARVTLLDGDLPYTIAVTQSDGQYSARLPDDASPSRFVDGRGRALFTNLAPGHTSLAPFAHPELASEALASLQTGATPRPEALGHGVSTSDQLTRPARLTVNVFDGLPFSVRVGPGQTDEPLAQPRPDGLAAAGWSVGGALTLEVEPGTYDVVVSRGIRYEVATETLVLDANAPVERSVTLAPAFEHPGYLWADPHAHSAPSHDALISMEDRVLEHASAGVQVHFGSDHDRVADYRPLIGALDLDGVMQSVVADEVSPLLRGHLNAYPLVVQPDAVNQGAVAWWTEVRPTTQGLIDDVRQRHGDIIVQANHPLDSGIASAANWSPGRIGRADFWVRDTDAMEVLNEGQHDAYFPVWLDLVARGQTIVPVGVSDSHAFFQGPAGVNGTWIGTPRLPGTLTDTDLLDAYRTGNVQVGLGVFLDLSHPPGSTLTEPTTLTVTARSPSYAPVSRLVLYENTTVRETVEGATASFELAPSTDALYVVVAEGDTPMMPVAPHRPWAMTNAYRFDADGDGWTPALPPLVIE